MMGFTHNPMKSPLPSKKNKQQQVILESTQVQEFQRPKSEFELCHVLVMCIS